MSKNLMAHVYLFIEVFCGAWVIVNCADWICDLIQGAKHIRETEQP